MLTLTQHITQFIMTKLLHYNHVIYLWVINTYITVILTDLISCILLRIQVPNIIMKFKIRILFKTLVHHGIWFWETPILHSFTSHFRMYSVFKSSGIWWKYFGPTQWKQIYLKTSYFIFRNLNITLIITLSIVIQTSCTPISTLLK